MQLCTGDVLQPYGAPGGKEGAPLAAGLAAGLPGLAGGDLTQSRCPIPRMEGAGCGAGGRGRTRASRVLSGRPLYIVGGHRGRGE